MKYQSALATVVFGALSGLVAAECQHNNDAGRWIDSESPAARVAILCNDGGGCYQAQQGKMCITGDLSQCKDAESNAANWQSYHDDWFLWTSIQCGTLTVTIT